MNFNLAQWVYNARNYAGLTQEELAHKVNLGGKANISAFENGRTHPTFKTMWDIGEACRYPLPQNRFNQTPLKHTVKVRPEWQGFLDACGQLDGSEWALSRHDDSEPERDIFGDWQE